MPVRDLLNAAAGASGAAPTYVEDVFSTYLYTGNNTVTQIPNGINLAPATSLTSNGSWTSWIASYLNYNTQCPATVDSSGNIYSLTNIDSSYISSWPTAGMMKVTNGVKQWGYSWTGTGGNLSPVSCYVDSSSNVYGIFQGTSGGVAIMKTNSSGTGQFQIQGTLNNSGGTVTLSYNNTAFDSSANIYISNISTLSTCGGAISKISSTGSLTWCRKFVSPNQSTSYDIQVNSVAVDSTGNVYVAGSYLNTVSTNIAYVAKWNSSGVYQWGKTFTGTGVTNSYAYGVAVDSSDNPYILTSHTGTNAGTSFIKLTTAGAISSSVAYTGLNVSTGFFKSDSSNNFYFYSTYGIVKFNSSGSVLFNQFDQSALTYTQSSLTIDSTNGFMYLGIGSINGISGYCQPGYVVKLPLDGSAVGSSFGGLTIQNNTTPSTITFQLSTVATASFTESSGGGSLSNPGFSTSAGANADSFNYAAIKSNYVSHGGLTGGLVWIKDRTNVSNNYLTNTVVGVSSYLSSNTTGPKTGQSTEFMSFDSNGFYVGPTNSSTDYLTNQSSDSYVSWAFARAPKFFDIVQYTGTGSNQTINHSLGSTPGCIIVKDTSNTNAWAVYHKGLNGGTTPQNYYAVLNTTAAQVASSAWWNNTAPTSTQFTVGTDTTVNASGQTYIAYIFADQAGGFGLSGTDNVISCGSFTTNAVPAVTVNLGYEPQYVMIKAVSIADDWYVADVMRGWSRTQFNTLNPDNSTIEQSYSPGIYPTATGFEATTGGSALTRNMTYIYIAIRRPMKVPTDATTVFSPNVYTPASPQTVTTNFASDLLLSADNAKSFGGSTYVVDRLRGDSQTLAKFLDTTSTAAEATNSGNGWGFDNNTAIVDNIWGTVIGCTQPVTYWNFRRAPTFFDEVCYTGTGSATTQTHNLNVVPEMIIVKCRSASNAWWVYHSTTGNTKYSVLNSTAIPTTSSTAWNNTTPTSSVFSIGTGAPVNTSAATYVAYLFATCAGVSKVGSFTGTGGTQSIACGFGSGGARFVLIKRTDSTGDWYCFDSANGLTSSSSPYLKWNSTAAQTTGNNGCYASSGGFTLTSSASATVNVNGGSYIFLAIA